MKNIFRLYMELDSGFCKIFMTSLKVLYDLLKADIVQYLCQQGKP